jgi:hypothetical protein
MHPAPFLPARVGGTHLLQVLQPLLQAPLLVDHIIVAHRQVQLSLHAMTHDQKPRPTAVQRHNRTPTTRNSSSRLHGRATTALTPGRWPAAHLLHALRSVLLGLPHRCLHFAAPLLLLDLHVPLVFLQCSSNQTTPIQPLKP